MGYWTTEQKVLQHEALLMEIADAMERGDDYVIQINRGESPPSFRHYIKEILKSCGDFPHLFNGRFVHLASLYTRLEPGTVSISLSRRKKTRNIQAEGRPTLFLEGDAYPAESIPPDLSSVLSDLREKAGERKSKTPASDILRRHASPPDIE